MFLPIADINADVGPTEFALGTHHRGRSLPELEGAGVSPEVVAAAVPAGAAVLFDYRLWHRGLPNRQAHAHRHVLYAVVAKPWWRDHRNHLHTDSIFSSLEAAQEEAPSASVCDPSDTTPQEADARADEGVAGAGWTCCGMSEASVHRGAKRQKQRSPL